MDLTEPPITPEVEHLRVLYTERIRPLAERLTGQLNLFQAMQPPTPEEIDSFIASNANEWVKSEMDRIADLRAQIVAIEAGLTNYALENIRKPFTEEEKRQTRSEINNLRTNLVANLQSMAHLAGEECATDLVEWAQHTIEKVPSSSTRRRSRDYSTARAWLMENRPDLGVKARGRISREALTVYFDAQKQTS